MAHIRAGGGDLGSLCSKGHADGGLAWFAQPAYDLCLHGAAGTVPVSLGCFWATARKDAAKVAVRLSSRRSPRDSLGSWCCIRVLDWIVDDSGLGWSFVVTR